MSKELPQYFDKIKETIWTALGDSAKDIMSVISLSIVEKMGKGKQTYPSKKPIRILSGRLARAIQGIDESHTNFYMNDDVIIYENKILTPYANISQYGGEVYITDRMFRYLLYKYITTEKKEYLYMAYAKEGTLKHKPFEFVEMGFENVKSDAIMQIITKAIKQRIGTLKNG